MTEIDSNNSLFERLFQDAPEPCAILAPEPPEFRFLAANKAYERCGTRSRDELIGRGFFEVFPANPDEPYTTNLDELRASFTRVIEHRCPDSIGAYRYDIHQPESADGEFVERWWSPRNSPIFGDDGEVIGILHRVEEVTEAVLIDRADGDRLKRDAAGDHEVCVLIVERDEGWRRYLEQLCSVKWAATSTESVERGEQLVDELEPDVVLVGIYSAHPETAELVGQLRSDSAQVVPRIIASARSGSQASRDLALRSGADDLIFEKGTAREILARIDAQLTLASYRRDVAARSRQQLHELFMNAPAFIAVMEGPDHVYTLNNPAHDKLLGHREVVGKPVSEVFEADHTEAALGLLDEVYETGEPFFAEKVPVPIQNPESGELRVHYLTYVYLPTHDIDGNIDGVAAFGWDVTELVEARKLVEEQAATLREESRLKDEFLAMLGHELRNPLAPLATVADLLKLRRGELPADKLAWAAEVVDRQVTQLTSLVDDLLDVARISQGRIDLERRPWSLAEIIEMAVETVEPHVDQKHQQFQMRLPDADVTVDVDKTRLTQIVSNLLHNASKYTDNAGKLGLEVSVDDREVIIAVEDDGRGIEPEKLSHIFELFHQADTSLDRAHGGLGLGLTLVRRLVEMHGGQVNAHSDGLGKGARFEVRLPVVVAN